MSVRLTPFQHNSPTVSGAAISNPAARSSLSPFSLPQHLRVVLDYRIPRARQHLAVARLSPGLRAIRFPVKAALLHPTVGLPAPPLSSPKGTTSRLLSCVRWPYINALRWFLSRAALGRWFYCRMLPVRFLRNGMPDSDSFPGCAHFRRHALTLLTRLGSQQEKATQHPPP
jgi:hypothetical protein